MANPDTPHGFDAQGPVYQRMEFDSDSGDSTGIFIGDVLEMHADGYATAAGVTSVNQIGVSNSYSAASTASKIMVFTDPHQHYKVQGDSDTAVTAAINGGKGDPVITHAGSTSTKISGMELDVSDVDSSASGFLLLRLFPEVGNALGTNAEVIVVGNEHLLQKAAGM